MGASILAPSPAEPLSVVWALLGFGEGVSRAVLPCPAAWPCSPVCQLHREELPSSACSCCQAAGCAGDGTTLPGSGGGFFEGP